MASKPAVSLGVTQPADWNANDQSLLSATLVATPTQRLACRYLSAPAAILRHSAMAQTMRDIRLKILKSEALLLQAPRLLAPWL